MDWVKFLEYKKNNKKRIIIIFDKINNSISDVLLSSNFLKSEFNLNKSILSAWFNIRDFFTNSSILDIDLRVTNSVQNN